MKHSKILVLLIVLTFSTAIFAQEKETEKNEGNREKEESQKNKIPEGFNPSTDSNGWVFQIKSRPNQNENWVSKPTPIVDVTELELSQTTIVLGKAIENNSNCDEQSENKEKRQINVSTKVKNPENQVITYEYVVSGGKIIGQGEKVIWDLSDVKPGTYTITAAVDEGCGFCGKTITKTIEIE